VKEVTKQLVLWLLQLDKPTEPVQESVIPNDHSFPQKNFPNSAGQFAKFCGSLPQFSTYSK